MGFFIDLNSVAKMIAGIALIAIPLALAYGTVDAIQLMWLGHGTLTVAAFFAAVAALFYFLFNVKTPHRSRKVIVSSLALCAVWGVLMVQYMDLRNDGIIVGYDRSDQWLKTIEIVKQDRINVLAPSAPEGRVRNALPLFPTEVRALLSEMQLRKTAVPSKTVKQSDQDLRIDRYILTPGDGLDRYMALVKSGTGDWLAFNTVCVVHGQCKQNGANTGWDTVWASAKDRFGVDVPQALKTYFAAKGVSDPLAGDDLKAACARDDWCYGFVSSVANSGLLLKLRKPELFESKDVPNPFTTSYNNR